MGNKRHKRTSMERYLDNARRARDENFSDSGIIELIPSNYPDPETEKKHKFIRDSTIFALMVREYEEKYPLEKAIKLAIKYCMDRGIHKEYLEKNGSKITDLMLRSRADYYAGVSQKESYEKYRKEWEEFS